MIKKHNIIENIGVYKLNEFFGHKDFTGCQCFKDCNCSEIHKQEFIRYFTVEKLFGRYKVTRHDTLDNALERINYLKSIKK